MTIQITSSILHLEGAMPTCTWCGKPKDVEQFAWRNRVAKRRSKSCKQCHRKYNAKHYRKNAEKYKERNRKRQYEYRVLVYTKVHRYLFDHPCSCGQTHPAALEFHHRDPVAKTREVSKMITRREPLSRIMREIAKCDVMCASCHRIATAKKDGWYIRYVPIA